MTLYRVGAILTIVLVATVGFGAQAPPSSTAAQQPHDHSSESPATPATAPQDHQMMDCMMMGQKMAKSGERVKALAAAVRTEKGDARIDAMAALLLAMADEHVAMTSHTMAACRMKMQ